MEDKNKDSLPEFDSNYIDQLFSAGRASSKKEAPPPRQASIPTPPPAEPEPQPVPAPAAQPKAKIGRPQLLLAGVILLCTGFLVGLLTAPDPTLSPKDPTLSGGTTPPTTSAAPTNTEADYSSMSTQKLVSMALLIPKLDSYGQPSSTAKRLTINEYNALKREYPLLAELEQRPDAVEQLSVVSTTASSTNISYAANALIRYYVMYLNFSMDSTTVTPDCQWLLAEDAYTHVYEYTEAPSVQTLFSSGGDNVTAFNFHGAIFLLNGFYQNAYPEANFWYRVEWVSGESDDQLASPMPNPALSYKSSGNSTWVTWQPYDNGWFIYGYAPAKTDISFTVFPGATSHTIKLCAYPVPESDAEPLPYAQCILDQVTTLQALIGKNPDKDLAEYPIVAALLKKPARLSALLNLAQANRNSPNYTALSSLLSTSAFAAKMTSDQREALKLLQNDRNTYLEVSALSHPAIYETAHGFALAASSGYWLGDRPKSLEDIPISEMNYWSFVTLTQGAVLLQQPDWDLAVEVTSGSMPQIGAWPVYDSTNALVGWVISGKLTGSKSLYFHLVQGETSIYSVQAFAHPLEM